MLEAAEKTEAELPISSTKFLDSQTVQLIFYVLPNLQFPGSTPTLKPLDFAEDLGVSKGIVVVGLVSFLNSLRCILDIGLE